MVLEGDGGKSADEVKSASGAVQFQNVSKRFGRITAVDQLSFEIKRGEIVGLLGPNGAGKTTAMRILTGYFPPSDGKVLICGGDLFRTPHETKKKIGYLPESVSLYDDMRVMEFLTFVAEAKGVAKKKRRDHVEEKMARCGLWDVRNRLIGPLSKGFRQRAGIAQALIGDPEVLCFDEPTNGLDPKQIIEIRTLIRELGKDRTLILSTHVLPEVSMVCDRVLILNNGRLVAGGTAAELEAGINEPQEIYLVIGDVSRKEDALRLLRGLNGVEAAVCIEERLEQAFLSLRASKAVELRSVITRKLVEHNIPLLEIRSGKLSLEDIFMKIVVREEPQTVL
ncbi:MAG: hypothetical protein A2Z83_07865 [Omnitrophica bacterium GWA2_52_8]|nr:MAG: hypothetical protein A2Z83_07865 [Omnitrophica bacterium GWA2_52_8]